MAALLALAPILLILALMVGGRWSAAAAGTVGLVAAGLIAVAAFGYGTTHPYGGPGPLAALGGAAAEALFVAATILWIIFPALCIFELQERSGAFAVIRAALTGLSDDPRIAAILVCWFFAVFMEGAAGFGTPVALAAPILVSLGFAPVQALTLVLIGHAVGVSFGAVGTPVFPQIAVTGFGGLEIARSTALLHALLGWMLLVFVAVLAGRSEAIEGATAASPRPWAWICLAAPALLLPMFLIATLVGPELPTLGGSLAGGALFVAVLRWTRRRSPAALEASATRGSLIRAALPYLVLLVLILTTRLIAPLREALQGLAWHWSLWEDFSGAVQPLYHPGTMLMLGFVIGGMLQGRPLSEIAAAALRAARRLLAVVVALAAMLSLSRIMVHAGMITELAEAAAASTGAAWPLLVPFVGALGSFVTGSATASNILLTDFQAAAGQALGLPVLQLVAGQGFGAAVGNIVCPHNVIAGAATVGLVGREGEVLRRTTLACLCYAGAGGLLLYGLISTGT